MRQDSKKGLRNLDTTIKKNRNMKYHNSDNLPKSFPKCSGRSFYYRQRSSGFLSIAADRLLIVPLILLLFFARGCGSGDQHLAQVPDHILEMDQVAIYSEEDIAASDTLRLVREQVFGNTDDLIMGNPGQFVVDDNGTIYIGDLQQNSIHIFLEDGTYAASIGREGDGPGEFRRIGQMSLHSNRLYVFDPGSQSVHAFSMVSEVNSIPEFSHTFNLPGDNWEDLSKDGHSFPALHSVYPNGSLLVSLTYSPFLFRDNPEVRGTTRFYTTDDKGDSVSNKLFEIEMPEYIVADLYFVPPPFNPRGLLALSGQGQIFSASTDEFLIKVHDSDGIYQRAIYYPFTKRILTRTEAIDSVDDIEQLHSAIREMQLPETWPALSRIFVDDEDRIWISTIIDNNDTYLWWVMNTTGDLLARFEWPRDEPIRVVKNGYMYTRETEEDTGLQQIVRYRIEMEES